jgi:hypothetical protein
MGRSQRLKTGDALPLDVLKEGLLLWPANVPEAKIVLIGGSHFQRLLRHRHVNEFGVGKRLVAGDA